MIEDYFRFAIGNIRSKGIRSWLTMAGIFIGIAAIVSLISLGEGMQAAIYEQFELLGFDVVYVMPGSSLFSSYTGGGKLTDHDVKLVRGVSGVSIAGGFDSKVAKVKYRNEVVYVFIGGIPVDETQDLLFEGTGIEMVRGQKEFKSGDTYKCAVGYEHWIGNKFDGPVKLGDKLYIHDKKFEVVAFVSRIGNDQDDSSIYIPFETFKEVFEVGDEYITIMARVKGGHEPSKVAEDIKKKLRRDRGLEEGEEDFTVISLEQMMESVDVVFDVVQAVLIGITAISLFVGGIGILNAMYTSVLERTREIGVMKSIGARNNDILNLFLIESGIIGMVGGVIGVVIGAGLSKTIEYVAEQELGMVLLKANISPELVIGALAFSFLVGTISGALPAYQASRLNPVDALRYE